MPMKKDSRIKNAAAGRGRKHPVAAKPNKHNIYLIEYLLKTKQTV
jgi:hypothetical protein